MNAYEIITNQIIEKMEQGIIPWVKPWHADKWMCDGQSSSMFPAYSYSTGKRYNFMNQMLLGFQAGEYATFNQIKAAGGTVKKGEHGMIVAGWIVDNKQRVNRVTNQPEVDEDGDPILEKRFSLRYYRVFNILTQCEGIEPKHTWKKDEAPKNDFEPIEEAERIINNYINSADAPKFSIVEGSNEAYYSPAQDRVVVPAMSQYDVIEEYYSTAFHELTHSTLKESRCNRRSSGQKAAKGSKEYSKEELVAEIGSCFLCNTAGLDSEKAFNNSVAYLQGWLKALKNDPKMIINASTQAEKAAEYILNA
jgi:antirestriction protein ArdC